MLLAISSSSPAKSMWSCRSPRRRSGGSGFNGPRRGTSRTIEPTSRLVMSLDLEVLAADVDVAAGDRGVLGADPSFELRPVDEVEQRLPAEPPGDPGGQSAHRHRLPGHHVEA